MSDARIKAILEDLERSIGRRSEELQNNGGMRVPNHGPFCSATPSVLRDLRHLARDLREAMAEDEP